MLLVVRILTSSRSFSHLCSIVRAAYYSISQAVCSSFFLIDAFSLSLSGRSASYCWKALPNRACKPVSSGSLGEPLFVWLTYFDDAFEVLACSFLARRKASANTNNGLSWFRARYSDTDRLGGLSGVYRSLPSASPP